MKTAFVLTFLFISASNICAQGIFTEKGNYSIDAGIGYVANNDFKSPAYNLSTSILGIIDIRLHYIGLVPNDVVGNTFYLGYFVKKDSLYGVELNGASVIYNSASAYIIGLTAYDKLNLINKFPLNFVPYINIGYLITKHILFGVGLSIEKK